MQPGSLSVQTTKPAQPDVFNWNHLNRKSQINLPLSKSQLLQTADSNSQYVVHHTLKLTKWQIRMNQSLNSCDSTDKQFVR